ncbi:hypothetical protein OPIT5_22290 [Opitutaceae bacterium TAV5]|nr:hypothetical protein OPIT5_22290 [Opitutaceae bacterium TAV5]
MISCLLFRQIPAFGWLRFENSECFFLPPDAALFS